MGGRLERDFYMKDPVEVAKKLLGKIIVRKHGGTTLSAMIVECEAYRGSGDKAAHFNGNKITDRTKVVYEKGGLAYIYLIYGMYSCFNIVTGGEGEAGAVLIRAAEPIEGIEQMCINRFGNYENRHGNIKNITNGPGKLCMAMGIDRSLYGEDLCTSRKLYIVQGKDIENDDMVSSKRVNIDYAQEAKDFHFRFYIKGNSFISKK
ncbi:DNA-3-methyladenine glycosylase [Peptoclostridium litorale DSM 5388]|uniref:Putative 3-methyladenine DNA glycosylase n=1 Tax=Peptoclostridium litorale DSM 5388 TaxID=1121324 RepID=A0A069R9X2_PEPLI|nr:DNA-3-methyladenine glycosylase [Peptoclostridium litorale]KDR93841.1 putative 3-methyladenine DNA glycosylase [Peptoclostridium litorale DSM 5388]SIN86924.1 DNA-3-methyladenine glycosylase [Peptoclostridium litorale DSM 5388]